MAGVPAEVLFDISLLRFGLVRRRQVAALGAELAVDARHADWARAGGVLARPGLPGMRTLVPARACSKLRRLLALARAAWPCDRDRAEVYGTADGGVRHGQDALQAEMRLEGQEKSGKESRPEPLLRAR